MEVEVRIMEGEMVSTYLNGGGTPPGAREDNSETLTGISNQWYCG
jgi:hypothetical protein